MESALRILEADVILAFRRALVPFALLRTRVLTADDRREDLEHASGGAVRGQQPLRFGNHDSTDHWTPDEPSDCADEHDQDDDSYGSHHTDANHGSGLRSRARSGPVETRDASPTMPRRRASTLRSSC